MPNPPPPSHFKEHTENAKNKTIKRLLRAGFQRNIFPHIKNTCFPYRSEECQERISSCLRVREKADVLKGLPGLHSGAVSVDNNC